MATEYLPVDDRDPGDERDVHRVAITVFMDTKGVDRMDASHRAAAVVRQALWERRTPGEEGKPTWPYTVEVDGSSVERPGFVPNHYIITRVHEIMDAGMALGNGYLWADVTRKAYPSGDDE